MVLVTTSIIRITLFVLIISTIAESGIPDNLPPRKILTVRLVDKSDNKTGLVEIRLSNGSWVRVCNDSNYKSNNLTTHRLCSDAKKSFSKTTFEDNSNAEFMDSVTCPGVDNCTSVTQENCPNGPVRVVCESEKPTSSDDSRTFHPSYYVYNGHTKRNCTFQHTLWMTYSHCFFEKRIDSDGILWTSSFIKETNYVYKHRSQLCLVNTTNVTSVLVDCINYCLKAVASDEPLSLVSHNQKNRVCQCFTTQTNCDDRPETMTRVYTIVTAKRLRARPLEMKYCIAIGINGTNNIFRVVDCKQLLPQQCGYTPCWPVPPCQDGGVCRLNRNFTFSNCEYPDPEHRPKSRNKDDTDDKNDRSYIVLGVLCAVVVFIVAVVVICWFVFVKRQPKGEGQRQNSVFNRTYGDSVNRTSTEHLEDCETYDLIDEERLDKSGNKKTDTLDKGVAVLGGYSSPNDAISSRDNKGDEYTTTYDDPIRKLSNHTEDLRLNGDPVREKKCDVGVMTPSDIELELIKGQPGVSEGNDKGTEGRKNQFTGCLCSRNVSAESDLEPPFDQSQNILVHKNGDTPAKERPKLDIPQTGSLKDERSLETGKDQKRYYTLAPGKATEPGYIREIGQTEDSNSDNDSGSDYEDTTIVSNVSSRLKKTGVSNQDSTCHNQTRDTEEGSDYEDSFVRGNMTASNDDEDLCLHSPPEELLQKLRIRIVPSESTYETYSALPKSRADWMNPYYAYVRDQSNSGGMNRTGDVSVGPNGNSYNTNNGSSQNSDNQYDKIINIKKFEQITNNTYDHISGLWKNQTSRKRLNSC